MALPLFLSCENVLFKAPRSSCLRFQLPRPDSSAARKQVTFADHRGLPLTRIKVFSQFADPIAVPLWVQEAAGSAAAAAAADELVLDFPQPSSDYLLFRQRLERDCVCLERCVLQGAALAGTVKVRNLSFEKSVRLRLTFDTWTSYTDVDCVYIRDSYQSSAHDTFSFQVPLPDTLRPPQHVEFVVRYKGGGGEFWDSNRGHNYRVVWSSTRRDDGALSRSDRHECYGGDFPDWPGFAAFDAVCPYY